MMQFFSGIFGPSFGPTMAYLSLLLIVVAIALAAWFAYRAFNRPRLASGKRNRQTRLAITDVALVDKNRRLVLLRRDDVEHLIMIGGHSDLVIESDIRRNVPARPLSSPDSKPAAAAHAQGKEKVASPPPPPKQTPAAPKAEDRSVTPKPAPNTLAPVKLQEETSTPHPKPAPVRAAQPPIQASSASTLSKIGAAASALGVSASAATSKVADAAETAKSRLAMPSEAKTAVKEEKKPLQSVSKETSDKSQPDPAAMKEMDALLEELVVAKK